MEKYQNAEPITLSEGDLEKIHGGLIVCGFFETILKIGAGLALGYIAHEAMT